MQRIVKWLAAFFLNCVKNPERGIGTKLFNSILSVTPQFAIECVLVDSVDKPTRVYLTYRDWDQYRGWHTTGTFVRFQETFKEAIQRCLKKETTVAKVSNYKITNIHYELMDVGKRAKGQKNHTIGCVFLVEISGDLRDKEKAKWFDINKIPDNTLQHQKDFLQKL